MHPGIFILLRTEYYRTPRFPCRAGGAAAESQQAEKAEKVTKSSESAAKKQKAWRWSKILPRLG